MKQLKPSALDAIMKLSFPFILILILAMAFSCDNPNEIEDDIFGDTPADTLDDSLEVDIDPIIGQWKKVNEISTIHAVSNQTQNVLDYRIPMVDPIIVEGGIEYMLPYFSQGQTFWEGNYQIMLSDAPLLEQENIYLTITEDDTTVHANFYTNLLSYRNDTFEYVYQSSIGLLTIPRQRLWTHDSSNYVSISCSTSIPQFEVTAFDTVQLYSSNASILSTGMELLSFMPLDSLVVGLDTLGQDTVIGEWYATSDSLYLNVSSQPGTYAYSLVQDSLKAAIRTNDPSVISYVYMFEQFLPNTLIDAWIVNRTSWIRQ